MDKRERKYFEALAVQKPTLRFPVISLDVVNPFRDTSSLGIIKLTTFKRVGEKHLMPLEYTYTFTEGYLTHTSIDDMISQNMKIFREECNRNDFNKDYFIKDPRYKVFKPIP